MQRMNCPSLSASSQLGCLHVYQQTAVCDSSLGPCPAPQPVEEHRAQEQLEELPRAWSQAGGSTASLQATKQSHTWGWAREQEEGEKSRVEWKVKLINL